MSKAKASARKQPASTRRKPGRPTKYTPDMPERLIEYFSAEDPETFPTMARFAAEQGVVPDTLRNWAYAKNGDGTLRYPEFFSAYKRAKDYQEAILVEGALEGRYQPSFAIFTAKNVLGWRDSKDLHHRGNVGLTHEQAVDELE